MSSPRQVSLNSYAQEFSIIHTDNRITLIANISVQNGSISHFKMNKFGFVKIKREQIGVKPRI
jgi:hypothetical protein